MPTDAIDQTGLFSWSCNVCQRARLDEVKGYSEFRRVASDCRPWPAGGRLWICQHCGAVQKIADQVFMNDINYIYSSYANYHQSSGLEQAVFNQASGASAVRSRLILEEFGKRFALPGAGRMLDIGCGAGAMLRAFHTAFPDWTLAGSELNDRNRAAVESIPGVEKLYTCSLNDVPGQFNIITMVHSLEHIVEPINFLKCLARKLAPQGSFIVQVPNLSTSPFELIVADHTMHFSRSSLVALLRQGGFETLHFSDTLIPKELNIVARPTEESPPQIPSSASDVKQSSDVASRNLHWLKLLVLAANQFVRQGPLGLFGSSIAATWLAAELDRPPAYFVDEDENRIGHTLMGRPILSPGQVEQGGRVFIGLLPAIASRICERSKRPGVEFIEPPPLD